MTKIEQYRKDTPGCQTKIHFNNAGASLMPTPVIEVQQEYLQLESITGGYETADMKAAEIAGFYDNMGRLLNATSKNIAFTSSATNSFSRALSCMTFKQGDSILLTNEDYVSNQITFLSLQKRYGIRLLRSRSLPEGGLDIDDMRKLMDKHHPKLVSVSHIPTNTGLIQPVEAVGKLCRERNITFLVDGCQSIGQIPIDVASLHCDFFTGTFRKFLRGPRGTGFLFVSDHILSQDLSQLFLDMRGADWTEADSYKLHAGARRFEDWELPYAQLLGSSAAVTYALNVGLKEIHMRNKFLCDIIRTRLTGMGLKLLDLGENLSSIITIEIPGRNPDDVLGQLRVKNINTSIVSRSSAVIDFDAKRVSWALRISPHYYNSEEEIELLIQGIREIQ